MAIYRQIYITFWQDPFILNLTPEEKYFYIYLMTNSKTKQCGCYELPKRIMMFETGYNEETIDKLLKRFIDYKKVRYDHNTSELLLINWLKYNPINNINIEKCVNKEFEQIKSLILHEEMKGLIRSDQGATEPLPSNKNKNKNKNKEQTYTPKEKEYEIFFEDIWKEYPNKIGKKDVKPKDKRDLYKLGKVHVMRAINRYKEETKEKEKRYILGGGKFFKSRIHDYLDEAYDGTPKKVSPAYRQLGGE